MLHQLLTLLLLASLRSTLNIHVGYLVRIFDVDWRFSLCHGACNSSAELHFDVRGLGVKRVLDVRAVGDVEQFRDEKALFSGASDKEQTATITADLQQTPASQPANRQHAHDDVMPNRQFDYRNNRLKIQ